MKKSLAALAVMAVLSAGSVRAQSMEEGIHMLETAAHRELAGLGLGNIDPMSLTLDQLARIKSIAESNDDSPSVKAMAVKQVVSDS